MAGSSAVFVIIRPPGYWIIQVMARDVVLRMARGTAGVLRRRIRNHCVVLFVAAQALSNFPKPVVSWVA